MSTKLPDAPTDGESRLASHAAEWIGKETNAVSAGAGVSKPCAACEEPQGAHRLLLTVDWVDYLVDQHGVDEPDEECLVPLCTRCRSWAEMLEIAEMNLDQHGRSERRKIIEERNRFLDTLRVQLISNFSVSETLSVYR